MPKLHYPGRDFVTTSQTAANVRYKQRLPQSSKYPCLSPIPRYGIGLPDLVKAGPTLPVEIAARCRSCENCLAHRRQLWTARAVDEIAAARRTWFGTLTVAPAHRFRYEIAADLLRPCGQSSQQWTEQRFKVLASAVGKEVTLMFKRMRKQKHTFRYLLVTEAHKNGWPHFHLLLHENADPIRKRVLDEAWPLGFSNWKLVGDDPAGAVYTCKYLAKDALTRVRASQKYGQPYRVHHTTAAMEAAISSFIEERKTRLTEKETQSRMSPDKL